MGRNCHKNGDLSHPNVFHIHSNPGCLEKSRNAQTICACTAVLDDVDQDLRTEKKLEIHKSNSPWPSRDCEDDDVM